MATASTAVVTALITLALGSLQMIDALIKQCTTAKIGSTEIYGLGTWTRDLGVVNFPKYHKNFKILIPSKGVCPNPVGVKMRVCDFPVGGEMWKKRPRVTHTALGVAYVSLGHNNDPDTDDFLMITVYCRGKPFFPNEDDDAKIIVVPVKEFLTAQK